MDNQIAELLNKTFEDHEDLDINGGVLIPIQKPGKPKGPPNNLRPITLLNTIRKALSTIILKRIRPQIESYLSESQSGFRPDRSTADVVWAHKWLVAKTKIENTNIKITGIDMSAAFDTIDRELLLKILEPIIQEDEIRLTQFLLSNTQINIHVNGATQKLPFISNVGTPQGDSLSPVLFIVYLEHALREVRSIIPKLEAKYQHLPREIIYADDYDNITDDTNKKQVFKMPTWSWMALG